MKEHSQYMAQKGQYDKHLDTCTAHFAQHFNQKLTPQQCREIMKLENFSTIKPLRLMKTWSKFLILIH